MTCEENITNNIKALTKKDEFLKENTQIQEKYKEMKENYFTYQTSLKQWAVVIAQLTEYLLSIHETLGLSLTLCTRV